MCKEVCDVYGADAVGGMSGRVKRSLSIWKKERRGMVMDHVSTDTKLKLVQMIRAENQENRMKMRSREQLVNYGSYGYRDASFSEKETNPFLGLRIRIGAAFLLFLGFLFLDYTGLKMGNVGAGEKIGRAHV